MAATCVRPAECMLLLDASRRSVVTKERASALQARRPRFVIRNDVITSCVQFM